MIEKKNEYVLLSSIGHMIRLTLEGEPDISGYRRWTDYKTGTINTTFKIRRSLFQKVHMYRENRM